ncbi:MAG TPA: hypothetical protein VJ697_09945, partial [Nitrososphaeraceae archaeon]|nr:hypothetical protein [Nitrososphaeraceae archaeon]
MTRWKTMNKRIFAYSIAIPVVIVFALGLIQSSHIAYGQTAETTNTVTAMAPTDGQNTFAAKGSINSLVIKDGAQPQQPNEQTSSVLDGKWKLEVVNGNVTDFGSKFTMVHLDGTNRHYMILMNFKQDNATTGTIQVQPDGTTTIKGILDVIEKSDFLNPEFDNVKTQITINKYNTISIDIDDAQTNQHFNGQPLRGVVDEFIFGFK